MESQGPESLDEGRRLDEGSGRVPPKYDIRVLFPLDATFIPGPSKVPGLLIQISLVSWVA